jgi:hypothetical protein
VDWLTLAYASSPLPFWVLGSILVYTLLANLAWLLKSGGWQRSLPLRGVKQAARFLFFLGIPYLALGGWPRQPFQGLLSLEDLGLVALSLRWPLTRWLSAVGTAVGLGLAALLLLLLALTNARRAADDYRLRFRAQPWWAVLVNVLYLEVHWAFYRSALAVAIGDLHSGAFLGLGLVYLEWGLNPLWRQSWRSDSGAADPWLRAALALVVALIFLFTRNLWACLGTHLLLEFTLRATSPRPAATPAADQML